MRKIIQIAPESADESSWILHALCDDGTAWVLKSDYKNRRTWEKYEDIPQDK